METQNTTWHAIWTNNSKNGFTLSKSDKTILNINKGSWIQLPGRDYKCIITKLYSCVKEDIGPNGMTYLPWRENEKMFASVSWSMRGDTRFIVCYPTVKKLVRKWDKKNNEPKLINRVINSITSRIMNYLSFNKFLTKLKSLCSIRNTKLYIVDEIYTSKTCGYCGYIKTDLNSNKIYKCNDCNLEIDRDYNGARNILLKHLI